MKYVRCRIQTTRCVHLESTAMPFVECDSFTFDLNRFIYPFPFIIHHQIEMCRSVITILIIQIREWQKKGRIRYAI